MAQCCKATIVAAGGPVGTGKSSLDSRTLSRLKVDFPSDRKSASNQSRWANEPLGPLEALGLHQVFNFMLKYSTDVSLILSHMNSKHGYIIFPLYLTFINKRATRNLKKSVITSQKMSQRPDFFRVKRLIVTFFF